MTAAGQQPTEELLTSLAQVEESIAACDQGLSEAGQQEAALTAQLDALSEQEAQLESGKMTLSQELAKARSPAGRKRSPASKEPGGI